MEISFGKPKPKPAPPGQAPTNAQAQTDPSKKPDQKSSGSSLGSLFGGSKKQEPTVSPELKDEINSVARRIKLVEEHFTILRRKLDVTEHNLISRTKNFATEIKTIHSELSDMKQILNKVEDKILIMIKEFQLTAKKDDLDTLKKYVDIWSPIDFVRRSEVEKIIHEVLDEREQR